MKKKGKKKESWEKKWKVILEKKRKNKQKKGKVGKKWKIAKTKITRKVTVLSSHIVTVKRHCSNP